MEIKQLLTKTLLVVAVMLVGGVNSVWADGTKRTLDSNDYTGGTTDWTAPNGNAVYKNTGTSPRKYYAQTYGNTSRNASTYKSVTYAYTAGTGYTTSAVSVLGYNIEFDFLMRSGDVDDRSQSEFVIPTTGPNIASNTYYSGMDYIFAISQPARSNGDGTDYGSSIGIDETWYVNDLSNSGTSITLSSSKWYHVKLVVTATSVDYTISEYAADGSSEMSTITNGTGSKTVAAMPTITGFWGLVGRQKTTNGLLNFTNFDMYDYTDAEIVTAPTIGTPVYAGANRTVTITGGTSSKSNAVTTYYTTDGSDPTSSSSVYSSALTIDEDCTVKAISISSTDVSSNIASQAVTVGKLTLNAPTFTKTAYADGNYTYTISDDQSALEYVPASTTIKYRVSTTGDYATYTSGVAVPVGSILYAYAEADNYTTSSTSAISAAALPAMTLAFGQNFAGVVGDALTMAVSEGPTVTNSVSGGETNYFIPSSNGTDALTNENISFYFGYNSDDTSQNKWWTLQTTGMYAPFGRGYANVRIGNLTAGQIVVVNASAINSVTGLTELSTYSYGTTHYYTATATTAYVNIARYQTVYSVNVYTLDNETVGALDCSTNYYSAWNTTPIWINAGETAYYKFKNYNNGGSLLYQNWYLFGATEASENVVIFGPNHSNTGTNATYTSKPTFTNADLNGATIELTATLADAGDDTYTLTVTGVTTKADGTTTLSPNLVYTQTNLAASKLKLYISPEKNWLELLEEAVAVTVSDAGYATYVPSNDLDFSKTSIKAYKVKVTDKGVATMTEVEQVPADTPVLLYYEGGKTENIPVTTGAAAVSDNDLVAGTGVAVPTTDGAGNTNMILNNVGGNVGFYFANNKKVATNRAYLHFATSLAPDASAPMMLLFDGETTGISDATRLNNKEQILNNNVYDLQGRKVAQPTKGLYIMNGRKVVIK